MIQVDLIGDDTVNVKCFLPINSNYTLGFDFWVGQCIFFIETKIPSCSPKRITNK